MKSAGQTSSGRSPNTTGLTSNIAGVLCYLFPPLTSIIFLVIEKVDPAVRFHAWQGTAFGIASLALLVGLQVLAAIMGVIASVLGVIIGFFAPLLLLALVIIWVVCLIKAYQGEQWRIPIIGDIAAKKVGL